MVVEVVEVVAAVVGVPRAVGVAVAEAVGVVAVAEAVAVAVGVVAVAEAAAEAVGAAVAVGAAGAAAAVAGAAGQRAARKSSSKSTVTKGTSLRVGRTTRW